MKNTVTMLCSENDLQMQSFIITTAGGKIIVYDGGRQFDAEKLLRELRRVTGEDKPHIHAWLFTHPHCDHIDAFNALMRDSADAVKIDALYYNFPSLQFLHKAKGEQEEFAPDRFREFHVNARAEETILWTGDEFDVGDAHFECLYSPNPDLTHNLYNNMSVVTMLTLGGKKLLFLGDAGVEEGDRMLKLYAGTDKLRADYVQLAHHGQNGVTEDFYREVQPKAGFWCTPRWLWENDIGKGFNTHVWKTVTVRGWFEKLGVTENYTCIDGDVTVEI